MRKRQQTIGAHVARQVDQDVHSVRTDPLGQLLVGTSRYFVPLVRARAKSLGGRVGTPHVAVAVDFESRVIVSLDHGLAEECDGMIAKMCRNVANAQTPFDLPRIRKVWLCRQQRIRMLLGPGAVFRENRLRCHVLLGQQRVDQIAVASRVGGIEFQRPAICGNRGIQIALGMQGSRQLGHRRMPARRQLDGAAGIRYRLVRHA